MSDSMNVWLTSDQLHLVATNVRGRLNVQTIVAKAGTRYRVYNFLDHPTEYAGPVAVDEYELPQDDIISAIDRENVVTINAPVNLGISWTYEKIGDVPVGTIDQIKIRDSRGVEFTLTSENADYPTALRLT